MKTNDDVNFFNRIIFNYSRHPLSRTPKAAAKKLEIVNIRDSEKSKKKKKIVFYILEITLT